MPLIRRLQTFAALIGFLAAPLVFGHAQQATPQTSQTNNESGKVDQPKPDDVASAPVLVLSAEPKFPDIAKRRYQFSANVTVNLFVEADGKPNRVHAIRTAYLDIDGHPTIRRVDPELEKALGDSAVEAVSQSKFKPAKKKDGTPVRFPINLEVRFQKF